MNETQSTASPSRYDDEIDLRDVFQTLWQGKWLIGAVSFVAILVGLVIALMQPNVYRAEALLAPHQQKGIGGLSALAAQYGGLASLAGIDIGTGEADKTALGLEVLKSRRFISEFIQRHDILVPLMTAKGWNAETGDLKIDADIYDVATGSWVRDATPPRKPIPSAQEAHKEFMKILSVSRDKNSGFVTVAIEFYSPNLAKQWVEWLIADLNAFIMQQDVSEAEQAIEYLNQQVASTSLAELQNVFFRLIEEQTKTVMLAKVSNEYLFKTLDPAVAPELKSGPKRALIVILAAIVGGVLGIVFQLMRHRHGESRGTP